ncbi:NHL repeat containing protein [Seminavis robusta]|uniref:NHL repeat containing protein n=1 Tax=Seminavis robusta TaxID=568900 RepID=A0A9N8E1Q7_9STRA|nr:NHL repeat containing protein [Seminavis robusta]|eukprot:Sro444_g144250.1 NHL repeat containing protein (356) ;mRNA; f:11157-12224
MTKVVFSSLLLLLALAAASTWAKKEDLESSVNVGGWGEWTYVYEPSYLPVPKDADVEHAHGIVIDDQGNIIITYKDKTDPSKCLLRWKHGDGQYQQMPEFLGPGKELCQGVPHGLRTQVENGTLVLYHANNQQVIHKTTMDGEIIWTVAGKPDENSTDSYKPTWFAGAPDSPYVYLADGYGSSKVYVYNRTDGNYTGHSFGGHGKGHGQFETDHAITYDSRIGYHHQMVVCDRGNHRLEYFKVDPQDPSIFEYTHTVSFDPLLQLPCNIRMRPEDGVAIIPFLEGTVGILTENNELMSVVNITQMLGDKGFLHPHDAHFVPALSGDFVLVTWNPGRIGYFRRVHKGGDDTNVASQ